jgi:Fe2+ or Zn2+ uptake regulation protein
MSVTTTHGRFAFICDMCGDVVETGESDFDTAVSDMRHEGWRAVRVLVRKDVEWQHHCADCKEEE